MSGWGSRLVVGVVFGLVLGAGSAGLAVAGPVVVPGGLGGGGVVVPPGPGSAGAAALRVEHGLGAGVRAVMVAGHRAGRVSRRGVVRAGEAGGRVAGPVWPAAGVAVAGVRAVVSGGGRVAGAVSRVSRVRVAVASHGQAVAAGADGVVFGVARADGGRVGARVRVRVSYAGFGSAFGGGFGARLGLVSMPGCALTTPRVRACRGMTPVASVNDWKTRSVSAVVTAAPAGSAGVVFAAVSSTSGGAGDFKATSLSPSSQWQVGTQTGDFSWSYALRVPPPIGGAAPSLSLAYDSGVTDGETAQVNSQPGQVGEGFSLAGAGGFIERRYASCADMITGKIPGADNTDQSRATGDECWDGNNAYLSLGGRSEEIVLDQASGAWHLAGDDGSTLKLLNGGSNGNNGDYNNSYWELVTPDGTQYYFGLNELPGWQSGNSLTNSVSTMPVAGLSTGTPCHAASYAASYCANMPYRWSLALVVDPNGNATSYFYSPQTSYYAYDSYVDSAGTAHYGAALPYTSSSTLTDIYYGMQDDSASSPDSGGNVYAHKAFDIHLAYADRCALYGNGDTDYSDAATQSACDSTHTQADWPDTPWDLSCASASNCTGPGHDAPVFFDTQMLATISTAVEQGFNTPETVDTWTLGYDWLNADVNDDLVLASVTHQGDVGGTVKLPPVTFGWTAMNNRVLYDNSFPAMARYRLTSVVSETGAQTDITYNPASCAAAAQSDPSANTWPCFPQYWTAGDLGGSPTLLWFYKYTVARVDVHDATGGEPAMSTSYTYCNDLACDNPGMGAAWHYDSDVDLVPLKDKSWGQWRGYRYVHVVTGAAGGTQSETDYTFLRGMDDDPLPGGKFSSVTVGDSRGDPAVTDSGALNGFGLETITYDGLDSQPVVSDQVSLPWISKQPTATSVTQPWGLPLTAYLTGTAETDTYSPLASGKTRHTETVNTLDAATGLLDQASDLGDVSVPAQAKCTSYTYPSPASAAGLLDYPVEVKTTAGACGTASPALISDTRNYYDGQAWGTAPVSGNVTETDVYSSGDPGAGPHWVKQSRDAYDSYGRLVSQENAAGFTTSYGYASKWTGTSATQAYATTQKTVTTPLTASTTSTTTTDLNPEWGTSYDSTDPGGERTDYASDPLGRVTSVWLPGQSGATRSADGTPNYAYAYDISATAAPSVATTTLVTSQKIPVTSYQIFDSLLRPRQEQTPAEGPAGGMEVTDTFYNSRGQTVTAYGPYTANAAPSRTLWITTGPQVPDETVSAYDGAGRVTSSGLYSYGTLKSQTTWSYPGADEVTEIPPAGGTAATTHTNALGQTTQIDQYHTAPGPSAAYDATAYSYTPAGQLAGITDAAGNQWSYGYDLLGRQVTAADPDTGTTTSSYNDLGQLTYVTDAAGKTVSYAYDAAGRKTGEYAGPVTGQDAADQLAAWTYDTAKLPGGGKATGQLASSAAYVGGTGGEAYTTTVNTYDQAYDPTSTTYAIPAAKITGALGGTSYTFGATYNTDGTPATVTYPAAGGLPAETVNYVYDNLGSPFSAWSPLSDYAEQTVYSGDGQPAETDLGTSTSGQWTRTLNSYDPATLQLTESRIQRESDNWADDTDTSYTRDPAGNITSAADPVTGNNQCYTYDYLARLKAAWTQPAATCATSPPGPSGLGGPAPYQQTLTYNQTGTTSGSTTATSGNITATTLTAGTGAAAAATTTSYLYPAAGAPQPHAATTQTTTTGTGTAATTQTWTPDGQLATQTTGGTTTTTDNWNGPGAAPGQLSSTAATTTSGTTTTSYRYDASGNLLLVSDGGTPTLYLPGEELTATTAGTTATRYYATADGQVIAARTPATLDWLIPDPQGTATTLIDTTTQNLTRRYYTPYGQLLTTTGTTTWPGTRGYIGGTTDPATGLTNLGAREYNPANPSFISPDPVLDPYTPTDLDPYAYAYNNPATQSDPTGLYLPNEGGTCDEYGEGPGCPGWNPGGDTFSWTNFAASTGNFAAAVINDAYSTWRTIETEPAAILAPHIARDIDNLLPEQLPLGNPKSTAYHTGNAAFDFAALTTGIYGDGVLAWDSLSSLGDAVTALRDRAATTTLQTSTNTLAGSDADWEMAPIENQVRNQTLEATRSTKSLLLEAGKQVGKQIGIQTGIAVGRITLSQFCGIARTAVEASACGGVVNTVGGVLADVQKGVSAPKVIAGAFADLVTGPIAGLITYTFHHVTFRWG